MQEVPPHRPARPGRAPLAHPAPRVYRPAAAAAALALAALAPGCALGGDVHLAPVVSHLSTAGGGREVEAAAGFLRFRRPRPDEPWNEFAARPLYNRVDHPDGDWSTRYLVPFGWSRQRGTRYANQLAPLYRYEEQRHPDARTEWSLFTLLAIWGHSNSDKTRKAVFPFGGVLDSFLSYDRVEFVLWPIWWKTRRGTTTVNRVLFPFFAWSTGEGTDVFRVWPLYGHSVKPGRWDRRFFLWPFFHWRRDALWLREAEQQRMWMFWPLLGRRDQGTAHSTSVLWPFFGWTRDRDSGFWSWDGPWPFVRIQEPGDEELRSVRRRFWPFYSYFRGQSLETRAVLWPIFRKRLEIYRDRVRRGWVAIPFWRRWRTETHEGEFLASWERLWPLYNREVRPDGYSFAFPDLNPLWRTPHIQENWSWLWELYAQQRRDDELKGRSWGGVYRRELDRFEDRVGIAGLWGQRRYRDARGGLVRETSLLFGLLRFRASSAGFGMLPPALPGPGWPAERVEHVPLRPQDAPGKP